MDQRFRKDSAWKTLYRDRGMIGKYAGRNAPKLSALHVEIGRGSKAAQGSYELLTILGTGHNPTAI
jgi:hypothetical protein